jgi:beta-glucosidase
MSSRSFPEGFLWGTASSGHQTEGENVDSDTWFLEHVTPTVFAEPSGVACGSWERWNDDLVIVTEMGLNAHRFSVEWARVEPTEGVFCDEAIDHYVRIVDRCVELGLAPVVTYSHFTAPHWFAARGGWLDDGAVECFARFCTRITEACGDRIAYAITFNEPNLHRVLEAIGLPDVVHGLMGATLDAAGVACGVARYRPSNVVLVSEFEAMEDGLRRAHLAAKAAIKSVMPGLPVGLSLAMLDDQVVAGADPAARDRVRAETYDAWLELASADDFIGVQNYERLWYDGDGRVEPAPGLPVNEMGSAVEPASLGSAVRYAFERAGVPVFVTEHGIATDDDQLRCDFIPRSLSGLRDAMDDGVPVIGYTHWTLLDNFEWVFGYSKHLGLVAVDRTTLARTVKPSARVYAAIVAANAVGA